jgi:hypothetical protein
MRSRSLFNREEITGTEKFTLSKSNVPTTTATNNKMIGFNNVYIFMTIGEISANASGVSLSGSCIVNMDNTPKNPRANKVNPNLTTQNSHRETKEKCVYLTNFSSHIFIKI